MKRFRKICAVCLIFTLLFCMSPQSANAAYSNGIYQKNQLIEGKAYLIQNARQQTCFIDTNGNFSDGSPAYAKQMDANNATNATGQTIYSLRKIWYPRQILSSTFAIMSCYAPNKCLYVPDASSAPYYIDINSFSNNVRQYWVPHYESTGYFTMETYRVYGPGTRHMDLYNVASTSSRLEAYAYSNSTSLRWRFYAAYTLGDSVITYGTSAADGSYNPGWPVGQCTWYCVGRAMEKCGVSLSFNGSNNNAGNWYINIANLSKGQQMKANSIAVFRENGTTDGSGHVVFVEYIENGNVYYTEANVGDAMDDGIFNVEYDGVLKRMPVENFATSVTGQTLQGYIYLY